MIVIAPHLEDFVGELLHIDGELTALQARHHALAPMNALKRKFVQKKAISGVKEEQANAINGMALAPELESLFGEPLTEASFTEHVGRWLENEDEHKTQLDIAAKYAAWAALSEAGRERYGHHSVLFRVPQKLVMERLVPVETLTTPNGVFNQILADHHLRHREGFKLTDPGMGFAGALDQANYCIKCHNQGKDSCSTGLKEKDGSYKNSAFGVPLAGCPLDEKISEMNLVKQNGNPIGALAIVTVDNPMAAGTGHRICNDRMKGCIYQKQEPGRHPADRDPLAQGRSRPTLGLRDLRLADALESAEFRAPCAQGRFRLQSSRRRPRPGGLHAEPPPDERRPHGRRSGRPQD